MCKIAQQRGYTEINLNVGCPSDRVQNGMFGACLMAKADLVADCVNAMQTEVSIPVTVKLALVLMISTAMNSCVSLCRKYMKLVAKNLSFTPAKRGFLA